jgi:hypothetical protein
MFFTNDFLKGFIQKWNECAPTQKEELQKRFVSGVALYLQKIMDLARSRAHQRYIYDQLRLAFYEQQYPILLSTHKMADIVGKKINETYSNTFVTHLAFFASKVSNALGKVLEEFTSQYGKLSVESEPEYPILQSLLATEILKSVFAEQDVTAQIDSLNRSFTNIKGLLLGIQHISISMVGAASMMANVIQSLLLKPVYINSEDASTTIESPKTLLMHLLTDKRQKCKDLSQLIKAFLVNLNELIMQFHRAFKIHDLRIHLLSRAKPEKAEFIDSEMDRFFDWLSPDRTGELPDLATEITQFTSEKVEHFLIREFSISGIITNAELDKEWRSIVSAVANRRLQMLFNDLLVFIRDPELNQTISIEVFQQHLDAIQEVEREQKLNFLAAAIYDPLNRSELSEQSEPTEFDSKQKKISELQPEPVHKVSIDLFLSEFNPRESYETRKMVINRLFQRINKLMLIISHCEISAKMMTQQKRILIDIIFYNCLPEKRMNFLIYLIEAQKFQSLDVSYFLRQFKEFINHEFPGKSQQHLSYLFNGIGQLIPRPDSKPLRLVRDVAISSTLQLNGANINMSNAQGMTLFLDACLHHDLESAKALVSIARSLRCYIPTHHNKIIKPVDGKPMNFVLNGFSVLQVALINIPTTSEQEQRQLEICEFLFEVGFHSLKRDPEMRLEYTSQYGWTALAMAIRFHPAVIVAAILKEDVDITQRLNITGPLIEFDCEDQVKTYQEIINIRLAQAVEGSPEYLNAQVIQAIFNFADRFWLAIEDSRAASDFARRRQRALAPDYARSGENYKMRLQNFANWIKDAELILKRSQRPNAGDLLKLWQSQCQSATGFTYRNYFIEFNRDLILEADQCYSGGRDESTTKKTDQFMADILTICLQRFLKRLEKIEKNLCDTTPAAKAVVADLQSLLARSADKPLPFDIEFAESKRRKFLPQAIPATPKPARGLSRLMRFYEELQRSEGYVELTEPKPPPRKRTP